MKWLILLLAFNCFAQEYSLTDTTVALNQATVDAWMEDFFRTDQLVVVPDKEEFFRLLREKHPSQLELIQKMESSYKTSLT